MAIDDQIEKVSKVRFIYIQPDGSERHFINGAIGGLTPRGEILCNFFFEYKALPDSEDAVVEGNELKTLKETELETEIIREIRCSIILNPAQARKIAEWLVGNADNYDAHFGGKTVDLPANKR